MMLERAPPPRPARLLHVVALAALASLGTLAPRAHGANPLSALAPANASAEANAPATVEAVAAADIPSQADMDERFAQDVTRRARQKDAGAKLGPQLDALRDGIESLSRSYSKTELQQLSVVRLESIGRHWEFFSHELAKWRGELERVTAPFSDDAAALAARRAVWEATQQSFAAGGLPDALANRVTGILTQIRLAEQALSGPLERQIELGRRANTVQASIDDGRKTVEAAIVNYDRRLARIDAPPVWRAWQDTGAAERQIVSASTGLQLESGFLAEWQAANHARIVAHRAWMAGVLALLLWLWFRNRNVVPAEPGTQAAARVLHRPISAWFVLVFVGMPLFYPDAPIVVSQLALLLALVPVLRLLPPTVHGLLGRWPYLATALFVAYRLGFLLVGNPLVYRLYDLGIAVTTAAALVWLLLSRHGDPAAPAARRLRGAVRMAGWLAVLALLVAAGANVIGNVTLAEMLTGAVLDSAYLGLALYAGTHVLASTLRLMLARRSATRLRVITQHAGPLLASIGKLLTLTAFVIWVIATANEFRIARPVLAGIEAVLNHPLEAGRLSVTLGSILLFVAAVWVAFWAARTVRVVLREEVLPKMQLPRGVDNSIATLSYYGLVVVGLMFALAAAGVETTQFALVFGALGVGIGLGLQDVVKNFVSGLILMFERPIQPGDVVEVTGTSGKVRDIGMRATTLTTFEGADVVVPNGTLLSEKLINWTLSDMDRRIDVDLGVAYGSDPRRVLALLEEVARGTPGVATDPPPAVLFVRFGASALEFSIRAWTNQFGDWVSIRTELNARVDEALRREGIEIPYPQQDLHLRSVSAEAAARLAGESRT